MTEPPLLPISSTAGLHHVDTRIFTLRFYASCMKCDFCHDGCCQHGCDVDFGEQARILAVKDELAPFVRAAPEQWFGTERSYDPEYPTGGYVRANVVNGACAFRSREGRGCGIHRFALQTGRDYHDLKPMACWLFPVCWHLGVLRPNSDVTFDLICAGQGQALYDAARSEIERVFGTPLVAELDQLRKATLASV
jgi:hypothetical protein